MTCSHLSRRHFLGSAGLAALGLGLPIRQALAAAGEKKLIFLYNYGGWDPTRVFATCFDSPGVDMEEDAEWVTMGDLSYVSHPNRPGVDEFFAGWGQRCQIINGVLVPSIAHENCMKLSMTGTSADGASDWPAMLAGSSDQERSLPHLVIAGPSFPGELGEVVTRTGSSGQLAALLSGEILDWSDTPTGGPGVHAERLMDDYLDRRLAALVDGSADERKLVLMEASRAAHGRAMELKDLDGVISWSSGTSLGSQVDLAVDILSRGLSRCLTMNSGYGWDTHSQNDYSQDSNFSSLFNEIVNLMQLLDMTPGEGGGSLADETIVVVLSEMGRTPQLNSSDGKDHWPYTSVLLIGSEFSGRVIGGFDDYYYGLLVDPDTGEPTDKGLDISAASLGATLLDMLNVDPGEHLAGTVTLPGILL
jgi:uncharacterized protein (DUF1501 family)